MAIRSLFKGLFLLAFTGCVGGPHSGKAVADVAGCYRGSGLERALGSGARAPAAVAQRTLVLDSVVEPGGKIRHARVVSGTRARAGVWVPARGDTLNVFVPGAYPPSVFTLRREGRDLKGTGQLTSEFPGVAVDTTSWAVRLSPAACAPALAPLPTAGTSRPPLPPALRTELVAMGDSDQAVRKGMTAASVADTAFMRRMLRTDSVRTARLQGIIRQWGWPEGSRAGETASEAAFMVLQHSPSDVFRQHMLPVLDTLAQAGEVSAPDVALLTDRVLMHEGLPQRYGSQFDLKNGTWVLYPVADSADVDARRAAMGLMPLALYEKFLRQMYRATPEPEPSKSGGH